MKMKLASLIFVTATFGSLQAQPVEYVESPATLTIALTIKSQAPGTFEVQSGGVRVPSYESFKETFDKTGEVLLRDDYTNAGKIATRRYGNAELLRDLLNAGVLEGETSTTGWGLFSVSRGEEGSGEVTVEARKVVRGIVQKQVDISELVGVYIEPIVSTFNFSETNTYTYDRTTGDLIGSVMTGRGTFADEGTAYFTFAGLTDANSGDPLAPAIYGAGSMTERGSEFRWYPVTTDKSEQSSILVSGGVRVAGIVGGSEGDESSDPVFVSGTASLGATRAIVPPPLN